MSLRSTPLLILARRKAHQSSRDTGLAEDGSAPFSLNLTRYDGVRWKDHHFHGGAVMGDHYTPRKYLAGFCDPSVSTPTRKMIWVYDRKTTKHFRTILEGVGQENDFYSRQDERELEECVERPANEKLDKLRDGGNLVEADRPALAAYIATFIYRVPHRREWFKNSAPAYFRETMEEVEGELRRLGEVPGASAEKVERYLQMLNEYREKHASQPTALIDDLIRSPWPSMDAFQRLHAMTWRLLTTTGPSFFMTSDNPVFTFHSIGLGDPGSESEFSFPISTNLLLHGSWRTGTQGRRFAVAQRYVAEMNRRTASRSTRFLFYHQQAQWVKTLGDKDPKGHDLNRIHW